MLTFVYGAGAHQPPTETRFSADGVDYVERKRYDAASGDLLESTDVNGNVTAYAYAHGRLTNIRFAGEKVFEATYFTGVPYGSHSVSYGRGASGDGIVTRTWQAADGEPVQVVTTDIIFPKNTDLLFRFLA